MQEDQRYLFSSADIDSIGKKLDAVLDSSASTISRLTGKNVVASTGSVQSIPYEKFKFKDFEAAVGVELAYNIGLEGKSVLLLKKRDACSIVELLTGEAIEEKDFEPDYLNIAFAEVAEQVLGAVSVALTEVLGRSIAFATPLAFTVEDPDTLRERFFDGEEQLVVANFGMNIDAASSEVVSLLPGGFAKQLIPTGQAPGEDLKKPEEEEDMPKQKAEAEAVVDQVLADEAGVPEAETEELHPEQNREEAVEGRAIRTTGSASALAAKMEGAITNLDLMMNVPMQLSVEIGRTKKLLREILDFGKDTLVVLDKLAGESVDLFVNGQFVAKGDVVVVDEHFGIRVTEILSNDEMAGKF